MKNFGLHFLMIFFVIMGVFSFTHSVHAAVSTITVAEGAVNPIAKNVYTTFRSEQLLQVNLTSTGNETLDGLRLTPTYTGTGAENDYALQFWVDADANGIVTPSDTVLHFNYFTYITMTAASGAEQFFDFDNVALTAGVTKTILILVMNATADPANNDTMSVTLKNTPSTGVVTVEADDVVVFATPDFLPFPGNAITIKSTAPSIAVEAVNIADNYVKSNGTNVAIQLIKFTNSTLTQDAISSIDITPSGTIDESADISSVEFYLDEYEIFNPGADQEIFSLQNSFNANNTTKTFQFPGIDIYTVTRIWVVYNLAGTATEGETIIQTITAPANITMGSGVVVTETVGLSTTLTIDDTPPTAPTAVAVTPVGGTVTANALNATNTNMTASATITAGEATGGYAYLKVNGTIVASDVAIAGGDTSVTFDLGTATTGQLQAAVLVGGTVTVQLYDDAENTATSAVANPTLLVDYVAPTVTITSPLTATRQKASKIITFTDSGDLADPAVCSIDGFGTSVVCVTGVTTLSDVPGFTALNSGDTFTLSVGGFDDAGNIGSDSEAAIVKDTAAPVAPNAPTSDAAPRVNEDEKTAGIFVTVPLGASGALAGDTLNLLIDGVAFSTPKTHVLVTGDITATEYQFFIATGDGWGADGVKSLTGKVTDEAGNVGSASAELSLTLDATDPTAPASAPNTTAGTHISAAEKTAGVSVTVPFAGSGAVAGDTLDLLIDGVVFTTPQTHVLAPGDITATEYTFTVATGDGWGADGVKTLTGRVTDVAGNVGMESDPLSLTLDTSVPVISSVTPLTGSANNAADTVGYSFDEAVASGSITFTWTSGSADTQGTHTHTHFQVHN
jgi:hypothetical protein